MHHLDLFIFAPVALQKGERDTQVQFRRRRHTAPLYQRSSSRTLLKGCNPAGSQVAAVFASTFLSSSLTRVERRTASSGRSVPRACGASAHGAVRGTSAAPLPPLRGTALPSHGQASLFLASPATRGRSGRSVTPWRGDRAGTFGDVAASSGGPSPARAHGRYALGSRGCSPVALGLRAQAGSLSEHPAATATLDRAWRSQASLPYSRERCCCTPA
ncbi:putative peptidase [Trichinella spiralis]|uniref:putative peptidase n=1 Tax=Trichinella spiralis TaxID=6334 RepID=UPI0001EFBD6B|nr:putative peptidase [Trichinella spiralis]